MFETTLSSLLSLPYFLAYLAVTVTLVGLFVVIYTWVTPHDEFALIRANNVAAAVAFAGALLGFVLPLASAIVHSLSLLDCAVWGAIALMVQLTTFFVIRWTLSGLTERIVRGELASGILVAAVSLAVGQLNAACLSY